MTDYGLELNNAAEPMPNHLRLARDFMHREARNNPSMVKVARAANISVRTLETSFRLHLDVTPHAYLLNHRSQRSRAALRRGRPIAEVAHEPHGADQAHLRRTFKRLVAATPGKYRRSA